MISGSVRSSGGGGTPGEPRSPIAPPAHVLETERESIPPHLALVVFAAAVVAVLLCARILASAAGEVSSGDPSAVRGAIASALLLLVPSFVAWWVLPRVPHRTVTLLIVLAVGAVIRVDLVPLDPGFSDDVYRYLWDGRVQEAGLNPYGIPPIDPSLDDVESDRPDDARIRDLVNHPDIATVYPPGLELLFAVVGRLGGDLATWKLLLLLAEALLALLLIRGLGELGRDPRLVLLYLWHPLPLVEVAWNAHAELLAVLPFLWCVLLLTEERRFLGGLAFGGAVAAKLLPIGFGVTLLRRGGTAAALGAVAAIVWLCLPYAGSTDLERATAGLREYAGSWYFNDLVHRPLGTLLGLEPENRLSDGAQLLRIGLGVTWVGIVIATARRTPVAAALALTVAFVLLSPTVHPWYLLWVLPFAVLLESRPWVLLAATTLIAYEVIEGWLAFGEWEPGATRMRVYAAPLLLWGWLAWRERREDRRIARELRRTAAEELELPPA